MTELTDKTRIIQEFVPGKQVTLAHVIANPDPHLYPKIGLPAGSSGAIGVLTITPGEAAVIAADIATHEAKAAAVSQCPVQGDDATAQQHQLNLLCSEAVALEGRVARFVQALEDAQQECSSKIHAAQGNTAHVGGGVVNLAGGGPGLIPIEPDLRVWEIDEARHGRLRSGEITQETGANGEALGLGEPVAGESAAMPRPEP